MATKRRSGLGRGLGAIIPQAPETDDRAIDVFFDGSAPTGRQDVTMQGVPHSHSATNGAHPNGAVASTTSAATETATTVGSGIQPGSASAEGAPSSSRTTSQLTTQHEEASSAPTPGQSTAAADSGEDQADNLLPVPGAQLGNLDPFRIVSNTRQPRSEFDEEALEELTHSIREFGVFQPIVVRPIAEGDPRRGEGDYELIMGERRLRATKASGRTSIPAIIRHTEDDEMLRDALLENLHRADLNPLEEASAYQQLLEDFGCSQQQLSERIGRSRPRISNTIRLLKLPVDVQRKVAAGILSAGHARAVLSVGEPAAMTQLADKIVNENLTVREAELAAATMSIRAERPAAKQNAVGSDSLNAHLSSVGERLGDRLNTRVRVVLRKTKGQISIDFASVADLNRILEAIGEPIDA